MVDIYNCWVNETTSVQALSNIFIFNQQF